MSLKKMTKTEFSREQSLLFGCWKHLGDCGSILSTMITSSDCSELWKSCKRFIQRSNDCCVIFITSLLFSSIMRSAPLPKVRTLVMISFQPHLHRQQESETEISGREPGQLWWDFQRRIGAGNLRKLVDRALSLTGGAEIGSLCKCVSFSFCRFNSAGKNLSEVAGLEK